MKETTLLLVGHGSRNRKGNEEILRFAGRWRQRHPGWRIETCFIEHAETLLEEGLDRAAEGARQVVVLPLILNAAGHVKMELPAALEQARARHPAVTFRLARHLGMGPEIHGVLRERLRGLMARLDAPDPRSTGVILLGRGSSDAGANAELAKMARWIFEESDHDRVEIAFTGVTWPRLETVVQRQAKLGMTQICIVPVYLFTGVLMERIKAQAERLRHQYPRVAFALGGYFGFDPALFELLDARVDDVGRETLLECDGCRYRLAIERAHAHARGHEHPHPHGA